jgi:aspartate/methionine/tyrosine aminotransferase
MSANVAPRPFAERIGRLGTETAYAVSEEAKQLSATGVKVYPYHIGDLNFATPDIFVSEMNKAIGERKTGYCAAAGVLELRAALGKAMGNARGVTFGPENVSIQSGGKPVIWKFLAVTMEAGDEVLYPSPGYPIYESMIRYLGGTPVPYTYNETPNGFALDMDKLKSLITDKTSVFIYNNYQNPMGACSSDEEMEEIASLCRNHNLWVLSDEAYFDIVFDIKSKSIVSLEGMQSRTVILHTYSKSFSMTGWRLGAAVGPQELIAHINRLNTNDEACTTHFIQWAGMHLTSGPAQDFLHHTLLPELKLRRDLLVPLINKVPGFHAYLPKATFYLFVNVTEAMKLTKSQTLEEFRKLILTKTGVAVCQREHFGQALSSDTSAYIRFAYSGINCDQIKESMEILTSFMQQYTN